jgi:zinc transporter
MPLLTYDIWADGRAEPAPDLDPTGPAHYRWFHFDRDDPALDPWCDSHLPEIVAQSLLQSETRPRCDVFQDGLIINLRSVNLNTDGPVDLMVSLRMWVAEKTIVTVRLRKVFALDGIKDSCAQNDAPPTVGQFLGQVVQGLSERTHDVVLDLTEQVETLEDAFENDAAPEASHLPVPRKTIIGLRRYLVPQSAALTALLNLESPMLNRLDRLHLREAVNQALVSSEALESLAARLSALQDHIDAHIARQHSRNGYALSLIAAIFLPLGFITGLFGVNLAGMPGVGWPGAFAALCVGIFVIAGLSFAILKWSKLL